MVDDDKSHGGRAASTATDPSASFRKRDDPQQHTRTFHRTDVPTRHLLLLIVTIFALPLCSRITCAGPCKPVRPSPGNPCALRYSGGVNQRDSLRQ